MKTTLVVLLACVALLVGCSLKKPSSPVPGDIVEISQTGEKVMVLRVARFYGAWQFACRVASPITVTHNGLVSRDSEVSRYSTVWFREFELREADE